MVDSSSTLSLPFQSAAFHRSSGSFFKKIKPQPNGGGSSRISPPLHLSLTIAFLLDGAINRRWSIRSAAKSKKLRVEGGL